MKTVRVKCFELRDSDEDGREDWVVGYTTSLAVASSWKQKSNWHSVTNLDKTYLITESLDDVEDLTKHQTLERAKSKLSKEELEALKESFLQS